MIMSLLSCNCVMFVYIAYNLVMLLLFYFIPLPFMVNKRFSLFNQQYFSRQPVTVLFLACMRNIHVVSNQHSTAATTLIQLLNLFYIIVLLSSLSLILLLRSKYVYKPRTFVHVIR